ncbi:DUF4097 family beta strand repeat-containing protein [Sporosarcina limicola]|uniref:DUF4097 domain-containing protein n=1 Tax=Sporosarcina limicola TaxID=34101 RepID=A0A927RFB4_9BACL|nr:DUF4097 family beta strand repeat-containing protein [Sporosarcina limicola]MBE1557115.1 hypothetical protein [Sporosarcina limicola]
MKKIFVIGVLILLLSGIAVAFTKKPFVYKGDLENVEKIIVDSDISNILLSASDSTSTIEYTGEKSSLGSPEIEVVYNEGQAIIKVKAIPKKWMSFLPGTRKKGALVLNIPPELLDSIQISTGVGNIDVGNLNKVNRLSLNSNVGNINVDSFKGTSLNINAKNGAISLGEIDGTVNIKNQTGNLHSLIFTDIKGKNTIKLSNGKVKLTLPSEIKLDDLGLTIVTKNGKITSGNNLLKDNIIKRGPGQKITTGSKGNKELNISVSVGNIEIN